MQTVGPDRQPKFSRVAERAKVDARTARIGWEQGWRHSSRLFPAIGELLRVEREEAARAAQAPAQPPPAAPDAEPAPTFAECPPAAPPSPAPAPALAAGATEATAATAATVVAAVAIPRGIDLQDDRDEAYRSQRKAFSIAVDAGTGLAAMATTILAGLQPGCQELRRQLIASAAMQNPTGTLDFLDRLSRLLDRTTASLERLSRVDSALSLSPNVRSVHVDLTPPAPAPVEDDMGAKLIEALARARVGPAEEAEDQYQGEEPGAAVTQ